MFNNNDNKNFLEKLNSFFDYLNSSEDSREKNKKLEDEMDAYNLDDMEKEEVRKGLYDPWDFEDDENTMEDDDYYNDDV